MFLYLQKQLDFLYDLNGNVYRKWRLLVNNWDPMGAENAAPIASELQQWLYEHAPHFPEKIRVTLINLGTLTTFLATTDRRRGLARLRPPPEEWSVEAWMILRKYQRGVEKQLGRG